MAMTVREHKDVIQHKATVGMQRIGYGVVDATLGAPSRVAGQLTRVKESVANRVEFTRTTLEAKALLRDHLYGQIWDRTTGKTLTGADCDAYFAEQLLADAQLRNRVEALTQQVLQPSEVTGASENISNGYVNLMAGVSTFWDEMQTPIPLRIEQAAKVENVLLSIHAGLDKDLDPDLRKSMLATAGCGKESIESVVPLSEYVVYENRVKDSVRTEIAEELDLHGRELTEHERILIDDLTDDRIAMTKLNVGLDEGQPYTYEEMYGLSAGELYTMFDDIAAEGTGEVTQGDGVSTPEGTLTRLSFAATNGDMTAIQDMTEEVSDYLTKAGVSESLSRVTWTQAGGQVAMDIVSEQPLSEEALSHLDTWIATDRVQGGERVLVEDPVWEEKLTDGMEEYHSILSASMEDNNAYLAQLEAEAAVYEGMTLDAFETAVEDLSEQEPAFGITEEDLAFAETYQEEQDEPRL